MAATGSGRAEAAMLRRARQVRDNDERARRQLLSYRRPRRTRRPREPRNLEDQRHREQVPRRAHPVECA